MPRRIREGPELLLLDTHVWIWYVESTERKLSRGALTVLRNHDRAGLLSVSPLSVWEIGTLVAKKRLTLSVDVLTWMRTAIEEASIRTAELTPAIALDAALLGGTPPQDPADRILIATARALGATLVTRDAEILAYGRAGHVRVMDAGGDPHPLSPSP